VYVTDVERRTAESIVRDRIEELRRLEEIEHSPRLRSTYQDRRVELEALLIRFHVVGQPAA